MAVGKPQQLVCFELFSGTIPLEGHCHISFLNPFKLPSSVSDPTLCLPVPDCHEEVYLNLHRSDNYLPQLKS